MSSTPPDVAAPPAQASSDPSTEHQSTQPALESKGKEVVSDVAHNVTDDNETADTAEKTAMEVPDTAVDKDVVGASTEAMDTSSTSNASQGQVPASSSLQLAASSLRTEKAEATETTTATDEHEKDKGSVSTTLTTPPAQTPPQSRSSKRKAHKSSSTEGPPEKRAARVEGNGAQKKSSTTPRSKRSFLSKLMRKLVPCVGPSRGHPIDIVAVDDSAGASEQKQSPPALHRETEPLSANGAPRDQATTAPPKDDSKKESIDTPPATQNTVTTIAQLSPAVDNVEPLPNKGTVPPVEPEAVTSGGVQPPGSTGDAHGHPPTHAARESGEESEGTSYTDDEGDEVGVDEEEEDTLILNGGVGIPIGPDGVPRPLLPPIAPHHLGRKCLVLDLDETLVHSSFKSIQQADYVVPVEIEYHWHNVYVIKRPGVDNFLKKMGEIYEVVVFTASLSKYADPVLDKLDIHHVVSHRLFRESCYNHKGNYVKDLSQLGRPMTDTIILDNSPASYIFHPNNAVPVSSWFNDPHDTELTDLCPFLTDLSPVDDVRGVLDGGL